MVDISFNKDEVIFMSLFFFFLLVTLGVVIFYPNQSFIDSEFTDFLKLKPRDKKDDKDKKTTDKQVKLEDKQVKTTNDILKEV